MRIDLEQFLVHNDIEQAVFQRWVDNAWIAPLHTSMPVELTTVDMARALLVRDLVGDMGVNDEGVDVALHLIDQIHGLRQLLSDLRRELDMSRSG